MPSPPVPISSATPPTSALVGCIGHHVEAFVLRGTSAQLTTDRGDIISDAGLEFGRVRI
jgi:hypothetical protein